MIVSTDSFEIAEAAKKCNASVPFMRPDYLASDTATSFDAIQHAIEFCDTELNKKYDYIVLLEPTSPLRTTDDIDLAIEQLMNSKAEAIVGVGRTEDQNPAFLIEMDANNYIRGYANKNMKVLRRQEIEDVYFFEGSVYISKTEPLLNKKTFYHDKTIGHVMPKYKTLEIDDIDDFVMVEALMKHRGYK